MEMQTMDNRNTMQLVLMKFREAVHNNYNNGYAYEAGYLQSLVVIMIGLIPEQAQQMVIDDMVQAVQREEQQVIEKMTEKVVDKTAV